MADKTPPKGNIHHSPYDQWIPPESPPPSDSDPKPDPDPDKNKDLSGLVPNITVDWGGLPSFNFPPPGESSGNDDHNTETPATPPIKVDLGGMRAAENSLLNLGRTAVDAYQGLRQDVLSAKDTVFGQQDTDWVKDPSVDQHVPTERPGQIQDMAREFAASMNPVMERALLFMGSTLELYGRYIALVNKTGQTYSEVDRHARFPEQGKDVTVFNSGDLHLGHGVPPSPGP
ncbi:hypothetical protein [Streptomyces sp. NBC_01483]|uniref:hypothetical protein n=1 Tax=Streptomyces sp. NBC_01483 TaxID=2903883 RepID=UPI002E32EB2D|nr:hypothetical protein [Streptomyces sp. NBC_01483]